MAMIMTNDGLLIGPRHYHAVLGVESILPAYRIIWYNKMGYDCSCI